MKQMRLPAFLIIFLLYLSVSCFCQQQHHPSNRGEEVHLMKPDSIVMERKFSCIPVETEARFINANDDWKTYLLSNVNYDVPCAQGAPPGTYIVNVNFLISKEGIVTFLKPNTKHGYGMEEEVLKVISNSPTWMPATRNGRKIISLRSQLVTFHIPDPF